MEWLVNKEKKKKKLNIKASNGYFSKKKEEYSKSQIAVVKELAALPQEDWIVDDIERNTYKVTTQLITTLNQWQANYVSPTIQYQATEEDMAKIAELKAKGLI